MCHEADESQASVYNGMQRDIAGYAEDSPRILLGARAARSSCRGCNMASAVEKNVDKWQ